MADVAMIFVYFQGIALLPTNDWSTVMTVIISVCFFPVDPRHIQRIPG
jgi:hypothetical protein